MRMVAKGQTAYAVVKSGRQNNDWGRCAMRMGSLSCALLCLCLVSFSVTAGETVKLYYVERPPYMGKADGNKVVGLWVDIAEQAFTMAGVPHEWSSIPAARQIENIKGDVEPACAVGYYRSPDRESYSLFTDVMFLGKPHVAIASSKNDRVIKRQTVDSLLSDRSLTLLAKKSYSYGDVLDNKITTDSVSMARMIAAQRADYMFCAEEECAAILKTPQLQGLELTLVRLSDMPQPPPRYFMCSRKVGAETISRVSEALRKIIAR